MTTKIKSDFVLPPLVLTTAFKMPKTVGAEAFQLEDDFQEQVVILFRKKLSPATIWFHVPNGGFRHIVTAKRLRKLGARPGVPDFLLFNAGAPDIALELKARSGSQEEDQREYQDYWEAQGRLYFVVKTLAQVTAVLDHYKLY